MSFVYPEILVVLIPIVSVLFYFWITQIPPQHRFVSSKILEKITYNQNTITLKTRNIIFYIASLFIIIAMAEPVIYKPEQKVKEIDAAIFVDLGSLDTKLTKMVISELGNIELYALDEELYIISPLSDKKSIIIELLEHLEPSSQADTKKLFKARDINIYIGKERVDSSFIAIKNYNDIELIKKELERLQKSGKNHNYIPLYYYPLAISMVLILIGLYSMSSRKNVEVFGIIAILFFPIKSEAFIFDFMTLHKAKSSYERKDYNSSKALYKKYLLTHDSIEAKYNYANSLYQLGDTKTSCAIFRAIKTHKEPLNSYIKHNLSLCKDDDIVKIKNILDVAKPEKNLEIPKQQESYQTKRFRLD